MRVLILLIILVLSGCKNWKDDVPNSWCRCWYQGGQCVVDDVFYHKDSIKLKSYVEYGQDSVIKHGLTVAHREDVRLQQKCTH